MTKKDYKLIARVIHKVKLSNFRDYDEGLTTLVAEMGDALQRDNERFDRHKFEEACWRGRGI